MFAQELTQIVESVWQSVVGAELVSLPLEAGGDHSAGCVTATIYFKGAWPGLLMITCSEMLTRRIASAMFQQAAELNSHEDMHDAVGEIVNILGGNLKALLPQPCNLSLPAVFDGDIGDLGLVPAEPSALEELRFESAGEQLIVRLVRDEGAAARAS